MSAKSLYKKHAKAGPGGRKCHCCYPAPGKARRQYERICNLRHDRTIMKEALKEIE